MTHIKVGHGARKCKDRRMLPGHPGHNASPEKEDGNASKMFVCKRPWKISKWKPAGNSRNVSV